MCLSLIKIYPFLSYRKEQCHACFRHFFLTALVLVCLSGCSAVGPDYKRPQTAMPDVWAGQVSADMKASRNGAQRWWQQFNDAILNQLIKRARIAHPSAQIARARVVEAWHQRGVLAAAFKPHVTLTGREEYGLMNYDENGVDWDFGGSHGQLAQFDFGWELDLFGKIKRQVEAADAEYEAKVEGWRDSMVFLTAEVALHYIALRTLEQRIEVAQQGRDRYKDIQEIIQKRLDLGISSQLEMAESSARYKSSQAQLPQLNQELTVLRNNLASMVALSPQEMEKILKKGREIPSSPKAIYVGVPSELLRSRPDIRRAERKMAAQTAQIGVVEAELYPKLSISGALTYEFLRNGVSIETLRKLLGIGASLKWRILNGCADHHRIKEYEAKLDQAIAFYEKTIIEAVTDVENAMTRLHYTKNRYELLKQARKAHETSSEMMQEAYMAGEVDLRRLLNAQQDFFVNRDEEIASQGRLAAHAVRLFKALGGGELIHSP